MKRIDEIKKSLETSNDLDLSKLIAKHTQDLNLRDAADLMMKVLSAVRLDAHLTNTRTNR